MVIELPQFQKEELTPLVKMASENNPNTLHLAEVFPDEQVFDNNYAFAVIEQAARRAARITGFNSSAPITGFADVQQVSGKLTKIQDSYYFNETDLLRINRPRTEAEREMTIINALKDVGELARGIDYMVEYLRAKLVYNGELVYSDVGTEVSLNIKLDRPEGNDVNVATTWNEAGSTPLDDLREAVKQYQATNNGASPDRLDMSQEAESALLRNEQIRTEVYGQDNGGRIVRRQQLQDLLTELGLPAYYVNTDKTAFTSIQDGKKVTEVKDNLDSDKVVLYSSHMGSTVRGITVENNYNTGKFTEPVLEQNPRTESIIVGEAVIPAIKAINSNVIMTVL